MLSLLRRYEVNSILKMTRLALSSSAKNVNHTKFRVLKLIPDEFKAVPKLQVSAAQNFAELQTKNITDNQDWQAIWPAARTFHPSIVPLPLKQGYKNSKGIHPSKYANPELMKIPNFLHLTPPVIKRHCEALKQFCTNWPTELNKSSQCAKYFPIEIITSDYCYSSPTIREPLARIVSLRVKLSSLHLNAHAKDKILRLVGDRYNPQTDKITIIADRCPTRKQNLDYVKYLLTALFHISWRVEPWENEICEEDVNYDWTKSKSKESLISIHSWPNSPTNLNYEHIPHITEYKDAISHLINKEENVNSINKYKIAVKKVLNLNT